MNTIPQTPRILPQHLEAFNCAPPGSNTAYTVRLLGTVTALDGANGTLTCGNNGDIALMLKAESHLQIGKLFEVIGKVSPLENGQPGYGLRVLACVDWGNPADCNYNIYEQVVNATHSCSSIFYNH
ncbi:unnamed protein product [Penicillium bialowiezense]